jgi:hypothetical protein
MGPNSRLIYQRTNLKIPTKYFVLAVVLLLSLIYGKTALDDFCPLLFLAELEKYGGFVLAAIVLAGFFISRPACKYICPLGAIAMAFNRISLVRKKTTENCKGCLSCRNDCPMEVDCRESKDCIMCMNCSNCKFNGIKFTLFGRELSKTKFAALYWLTFVVVFAAVFSAGVFAFEPINVKGSGEAGTGTESGIELSGSEVKKMTIQELADYVNVDVNVLITELENALGIQDLTPDTTVQELKDEYGIKPSQVKEVLAKFA